MHKFCIKCASKQSKKCAKMRFKKFFMKGDTPNSCIGN